MCGSESGGFGSAGALRSLGAEQTSDLVDLTEGDMEGIGMKKLEIKRLQRATSAG